MASNRVQEIGRILEAYAASISSGDPVVVGQIPGVALTDSDSSNSNKFTVQTDGVFNLSVKGVDGSGSAAVNMGDILYYNSGSAPKLNKADSGVRFGYALEAVDANTTDDIDVKVGY